MGMNMNEQQETARDAIARLEQWPHAEVMEHLPDLEDHHFEHECNLRVEFGPLVPDEMLAIDPWYHGEYREGDEAVISFDEWEPPRA